MKKILIGSLIFSLLCNGLMAQNIHIKGRITDVDTLFVLIRSLGKSDTILTFNGQFEYKSILEHPMLFTIVCVKNKQSIEAIKENNERKMRQKDDGIFRELFLDEGEVNITTSFRAFDTASLSSSNHFSQDRYNEFRTRFNPLVKAARAIIDSSFTPGRTEQEKLLCRNLLDRVNQIENEVAEKFVAENTANAVGAYVLYRYCKIDDYDRLAGFYNKFGRELKGSGYLKIVKDKLDALSSLEPGKPVPQFSAQTSKGTTIRFNDFRGKYVILDFWGTWCRPCISGIPRMKEYYRKYSERLEIIGVACKNTRAEWLRSIEDHEMNWVNVLNGTGSDDLTAKYSVEAFPTKILIDQEGNLLQVFTGETEAFYQKLDSIFNGK